MLRLLLHRTFCQRANVGFFLGGLSLDAGRARDQYRWNVDCITDIGIQLFFRTIARKQA